MHVSESSNAISGSQPTAQPQKRMTGWARLKAGSQDQPTPPTQAQQPKQESFGDSLQCNLERLNSKDSSDGVKPRMPQKPCDKPGFDYDESIAEMVESSKVTQQEVQKLTERVAKMEEIISDFVVKLNAALPIVAAGMEEERHYTKRSKSKTRHHHRSSSGQTGGTGASPGGGGAGTATGQTNSSHPGTPSNSGNSLKISNNLKLVNSKNEEFL